MITRKAIIEIISALLALVFAYTAVSKLIDFAHFKITLSKSPFLSPFANVIAFSLPPAEIMTAVALSTKKFRLHALYFSFLLMSSFTSYIYAMLYYGSDLPCSCGSVLAGMSWPVHLVFNILLTLLTALAIILFEKENKLYCAITGRQPNT